MGSLNLNFLFIYFNKIILNLIRANTLNIHMIFINLKIYKVVKVKYQALNNRSTHLQYTVRRKSKR